MANSLAMSAKLVGGAIPSNMLGGKANVTRFLLPMRGVLRRCLPWITSAFTFDILGLRRVPTFVDSLELLKHVMLSTILDRPLLELFKFFRAQGPLLRIVY